VTPAGVVLDSGGIMISQILGTQGDPALAFDGTNFLVAWTDVRGSFPPELGIYGTRVTQDGTVLDPAGITIGQAAGVQGIPALGFDGANFLAVWEDFRGGGSSDIYGARVAPDGTLLDGGGIVIAQAAEAQAAPALAFDGTNSLVVWQDLRNDPGAPDIFGARVATGGSVLDSGGIVISQAARAQSNPALGYDGANFLVVWEDFRSGTNSDIYGARVTPGGTVLDPTGIAIGQAGNDQRFPALGYDGANYLVVWQDLRNDPGAPDIYGARVTPGGAVLDPSGFAISQATGNQLNPALDFDGGNFLVVWEDQRGGGLADIYGARVAPDGTVLDPAGLAIAQAPEMQTASALDFNGTDFLVVWVDYRVGDGYADIYGARVAPGGTVLDPGGFAITQAVSNQYAPAIDHDGANSLVVWEDYRSNIYPDIYGARVTPGGAVLDSTGIVVSRAAKGQYAPVLAYDGARFLVVWEDHRSSNNPDIYGAWVVPGDTIYDEGSVVRQEGVQGSLALARGTGSRLFLVYQGWAGTIGTKTYNTDRIWGAMNPTPGGGVEEGPSDEVRTTRDLPTVVRGVLYLPEAPDRKARSLSLLDTAGRKVLDLHPGPNDVRSLAPGVYLVREGQGGDGLSGRTRKVIIQR
jgi:phosphoribosylformylglycinamidine (FGAM) synthase PurS component